MVPGACTVVRSDLFEAIGGFDEGIDYLGESRSWPLTVFNGGLLDRAGVELEALRWTMEGKTAWEVGTILGISERTAVLHVNNAMHKLGCASKHQAVLKALRLGLIS